MNETKLQLLFMMKKVFLLLLFINYIFTLFAIENFPEKIIAESPDPLNITIGSPSIAVLPDGIYVASHDWGGSLINANYTSVYSSENKGETWKLISTVKDLKWANIFWFNGKLYMMGVKSAFGDICIRRSDDSGKTWTDASTTSSGILFQGRYHTAPVPVVFHNGRIWRSFEESPDPENSRNFHSFVISAPVDSDLLKAASWTKSNRVKFNPEWINASNPEWLEGNVVITPENKIANLLRLNSEQETNGMFDLECPCDAFTRYNIAAMLPVSDDGTKITFDPFQNFVNFPGALSKFTVRFDSVSGKYWTIVNKITKTDFKYLGSSNSPRNQRNVLVLYSSSDLQNWEEKFIVMRWREGEILTRRVNFGFQYADWQIDGNDIVAVVRTSWYSSDWHDSNMLSFHKISNFRNVSLIDSPKDLKELTENVSSILEWQFTSPACTGKEITINSTTTDPNLQVSVLSRGSGLYNTSGFARSFSAETKLATVENNSKSVAIEDNQYFQFTVQSKPGYSVSLSTIDAKLSRNTEGPTSYRWQYSLDGVNFVEISSGDVFDFYDNDGEGEIQTTVRLDRYSDLQNLPASNQVTFRIYFWRATSNTGRISFGRYKDTTPSLKVGGAVIPTVNAEMPVVAWTFSGLSGITAGSLKADVVSDLIPAPYLSRGAGLTPVSLNNAYYSYFSSYVSGMNTKADAIRNGDYYTFTIQSESTKMISLSKLNVKLRRNSNGPISYRWMYSVDQVNFHELGSSDIVFLINNDEGVIQTTVDLSSVPDLQKVKSDTPIQFRLYAWGSTSSTGGLAFGRYTGQNCLEVFGKVEDDVQVLNAWQFYDDNNYISTGREESFQSTTTNKAVLQSTLTRGIGNTITSSGHVGGFIGYLSVSQSKQEAIEKACYFEFKVQVQPGIELSLYEILAKIRRQEFSAHTYRWMYSLNETDFFEIGDQDVYMNQYEENNGYFQPGLLLNGYSDLQNLRNNKTVTFRLYAWGGTETLTTRKHFGFGQSKLITGPSLSITGYSQKATTTTSPLGYNPNLIKIFPGSDAVFLQYSFNSDEKIMLEFRDMVGKVLKTMECNLAQGEHTLRIPFNMNKGIYIITLRNHKINYSIKFIK